MRKNTACAAEIHPHINFIAGYRYQSSFLRCYECSDFEVALPHPQKQTKQKHTWKSSKHIENQQHSQLPAHLPTEPWLVKLFHMDLNFGALSQDLRYLAVHPLWLAGSPPSIQGLQGQAQEISSADSGVNCLALVGTTG